MYSNIQYTQIIQTMHVIKAVLPTNHELRDNLLLFIMFYQDSRILEYLNYGLTHIQIQYIKHIH